MAEAKINDSCIIGLPTCGYAFSSARMAFIAAPADEEFQLELDILTDLLEEKEYESYLALQRLEPGKFAFCTKICSKIITSQFCIALLNASVHRESPEIRIPNPNVHLEYGLMLAFKKYVLPFQREGDTLAFNIRPLDTIIYSKKTFKDLANRAIDEAILGTATTSRPTRGLGSNELVLRYLAARRLRVTNISTDEGAGLYRLGSPFGFNLVDGDDEIVYLGVFDTEPAKEIAFRLKLLLQNLHGARQRVRTTIAPDAPELAQAQRILSLVRIEIIVAPEIDQGRISERVRSLVADFEPTPWTFLTAADLQARIDAEYGAIGDL